MTKRFIQLPPTAFRSLLPKFHFLATCNNHLAAVLIVPDWFLFFVQVHRKFTVQPPDHNIWGVSSSASEDDSGEGQESFDLRPAVGMRVEGFFKYSSQGEETPGRWYAGKITSQNEDGSWHVDFEDGDDGDYEGLKEDELRLASGPWESWLDAYLPDLLISAYRSARRDPARFDKRRLELVHNPEKCCHGNDAAASCAGTPATQVKRRRI